MVRSRKSSSSSDTKNRILDATQAVLLRDGVLAATARGIAAEGDFNQALVFYHFGSIDGLLLAAVERSTKATEQRNRERLATVSNLGQLVEAAVELRQDPQTVISLKLATQLIAGMGSDDELRASLRDLLQPTLDELATVVRRVTADTPAAGSVDPAQVAWGVSAMFYGMLLLGSLEPDESRMDAVFGTLGSLTEMVDPLMAFLPMLQSKD